MLCLYADTVDDTDAKPQCSNLPRNIPTIYQSTIDIQIGAAGDVVLNLPSDVAPASSIT
jgi:hypothetical protein